MVQPAVPRHGLALAARRAFAGSHAQRTYTVPADGTTLCFEELTTELVVELVIKPETAAAGPGGADCTYAELLLSQVRGVGRAASRALTDSTQGATDDSGRPRVATATRFVSHAWLYPFLELLDALEAYSDAADAYFWVGSSIRRKCTVRCPDLTIASPDADAFVGYQHAASELPPDWWTNTFRQSIAEIGHTLVVLQPWNAPLPLRRSWCLWELFCTLDGGARLEVALSMKQRAAFQQALVRSAKHPFEVSAPPAELSLFCVLRSSSLNPSRLQ